MDSGWIRPGRWRVTSHLTINYGLRYEVNTPYTDVRNRMNAWVPGQQSTVMPSAPPGLLFPGDPGVPAGIANVDYHEFMPRIGFAWDPSGNGKLTIRSSYGIFYDSYTNGVGGPLQAAVSALPWTEAYQLSGPWPELRQSLQRTNSAIRQSNVRPTRHYTYCPVRYATSLFAKLEFLG